MTKYEQMNEVAKDIEAAFKEDRCESFINDLIDKKDNIADLAEELESGFVSIDTKYGEMEIELENGRLEYDGTSMNGGDDFYWAAHEIKDSLENTLSQARGR